jgi:hypothetical protein
MKSNAESLFEKLFGCNAEDEVTLCLDGIPDVISWKPLGDNETNFGVIENQQSSPIAALIEKVTNSIDAILMRKCYEAVIDPKSADAPRTMEDAIKIFFKKEQPSWHLGEFRQKQAEEIQILADGPKLNPSLTIYDNGEGQHPKDFVLTFLSLLRGNKNEIHFVQGKYNMGGTGAMVFCGKRRYQLIASRRYDGTGNFGFTLVRKHPLTEEESQIKKNTWYEYLLIGGQIPNFPIESLDLRLKGRQFTTGTVIKLYSYDLPAGSRSVISRDLNQSINEFLFDPALPIYTIDRPERYPDDRNLARELFGLKRRLEQYDSKYIETHFSEENENYNIGKTKVTCYVFRNKIEDKTLKESRESIEREFFKNDMAVMFSLNGQVHGHYTNEFITRTLKMPLLKYHLLIHVDCTHMKYEFRNELFMASRDRLKDGEQSRELRALVGDILIKSQLKEIYKRRKDSITMETGETNDLLKSISKSLPLNSDLLKLLKETFKLEENKPQPGSAKSKHSKPDQSGETSKELQDETEDDKDEKQLPAFIGKRFPSFFKLNSEGSEAHPAAKIPLGSKRSVRFLTDAEDQYFDRSDEPGDLKVSLLSFKQNETSGGHDQGSPKELSGLLNVTKSSPSSGSIRVSFNPTNELQVDDMIEMQATLDGPGVEFEERFWVNIVAPEKQKPKAQKEEETKQDTIGLPPPVLVYQEKKDQHLSWAELEASNISFGFETIMHPYVEGEILERIYINMDSSVLKTYKSKLKHINEEQLAAADKKYITSVYFHTLFLYTISKKKNYSFKEADHEVDLGEYLKDVFASYYSEFLLNFGMEQLMATLEM